jgi:uncharacterized DUF497 family protein
MAVPIRILWSDDPEDDVVGHLAEHGVTIREAEEVLTRYFDDRDLSRAGTGRWIVQGFTRAGRYLVVVFDYYEDEDLVIPVTAFEPQDEA